MQTDRVFCDALREKVTLQFPNVAAIELGSVFRSEHSMSRPTESKYDRSVGAATVPRYQVGLESLEQLAVRFCK